MRLPRVTFELTRVATSIPGRCPRLDEVPPSGLRIEKVSPDNLSET